MVYLLFLLISTVSLATLKKYRDTSFNVGILFYLFPIIALWCLLIGGQYEVGTDYPTYLHFFEGYDLEIYENTGEWLFVGMIRCCNWLGITGQGIYFLIAFASIVMLIYAANSFVPTKYIHVFFFVFIVYSGVFNNQMNTVRQYIVVYIFTVGIVKLLNKQYWSSIILFVMMPLFHKVSVLLFPFILFLIWSRKRIESKYSARCFLTMCVLFAVCFSFIAKVEWLFPLFQGTPLEFYSSQYMQEPEEMGMMYKLTKFVYVPFVLYSIYLFPTMALTPLQRKYFVIGVYGYSIKVAFLTFDVLNRMGTYFEILMCIPIVYLLITILHRKKKAYILVCFFFLLIYALKVTLFAVREYSYDSYFLKFI